MADQVRETSSTPSAANPTADGPRVSMQGVRQELWSPTESEPEASGILGDQNLPQTKQVSAQGTGSSAYSIPPIPDALRPGIAPPGAAYEQDEGNPWDDAFNAPASSTEPKERVDEVPRSLMPGLARTETNPFKRKPLATSQNPTSAPAMPSAAPPPVPPTNAFAQLQLQEHEPGTNPWQPALDDRRLDKSPSPMPSVPTGDSESGRHVWGSGAPSRQPSTEPSRSSPALVSSTHSEGEASAWDIDEPSKPSLSPLPEKSPENPHFSDDPNAWDDLGSKGKHSAVPASQKQTQPPEGWNLIDHDPIPESALDNLSRQSSWENFADADDERSKPAAPSPAAAADLSSAAETAKSVPAPAPAPAAPSLAAVPPSLPPRAPADAPPSQPARPQPKSETYQIKNINWYDASVKKTRKSPVLVQNANGPCPLVALVNALTLTTPVAVTSNLVETLRTREQVSLNFLLEAVFDELMSPRRTDPNKELPDMTELYDFLKGLHTGMNVNPRFTPALDQASSVSGTFEDTRDMKLYATFSIPLVHGWIPSKDDPVVESFGRQGSSYDEVQTLLFREEELEYKLSTTETGLTEQEQQLYQDVVTIKSWLSSSATQLTPYGLDLVTKSLEPGAVSILFRNDHFSTLYRNPHTRQLLTLVTDAGYYKHDEVVWESLVDVNGERAEFFSGDFRGVGGPQHSPQSSPVAWYEAAESSSNAGGGEWQTVQSRQSRSNPPGEAQADPPLSPQHEQEDRDLALALQLQEEEEERHRAEQAARRRESQLSEQFIEQQGRQGSPVRGGARGRGSSAGRGGGAPATPARTSSAQSTGTTARGRGGTPARGGRAVQQVRSLIPPVGATTHRAATDSEDAPPTYEQASKATPYVPPAGHPNHPASSPSSALNRRRSEVATPQAQANPSLPGRPRPAPAHMPPHSTHAAVASVAQPNGGRDRDCAVM